METSSAHNDTVTQSVTNRHHLSFTDLPRELRDEIIRLILVGEDLKADLTDRPCATYRALAQVTRLVREESADIYWSCSQRSFWYSTPFSTFPPEQTYLSGKTYIPLLLPQPVTKFETLHATWWSVYDFDELEAWYNAYGKLALHRVRHLRIRIRPCARHLDVDLVRPQIQMKLQTPHQAWGCEDKIEAFALAVLVTDGQIRLTLERFTTLCSALASVGLAKFGFMDLAPKDHEDTAITELLSIHG